MPSHSHVTAKQFFKIADILTERGYYLGQKIGEGCYSEVMLVERTKDSRTFAAKIIKTNTISKDYLHKFLTRELKAAVRIDHEYCIGVHEIIQTGDLIFLIMDYAERGDLLDYVKTNGPLQEFEAKRYFQQLSEAVQYLHEEEIAHRDLKCENILIHRNRKIAVSDFGFARSMTDVGQGSHSLSSTFCGSAAYASPELLQGFPYNPKANDVWSLGCILFIMVCGTMPFDDGNITKMVHTQLSGNIKFPTSVASKVRPMCKHLIRQMLEGDPEKRLSISQVLCSAWLNSP